MDDELIRKSEVLSLLNKTKVALWHDNFAGAVLIAIHPLVLFEFERRAYNAEHGTNLSYGVYRAYKERGWLNK